MMARLNPNQDEIVAYQNWRYVSSIEAHWRLMSFDMVGRSPTVIVLPVHLPGQNFIQFSANTDPSTALQRAAVSHLETYFEALTNGPVALRPAIRNLRFAQFFSQYIMTPHVAGAPLPDGHWPVTAGQHQVAFHHRQRGECLCRLQKALLNAGERFFLRLILRTRPCTSWVDARTHNGTVYATYQEAARAMGALGCSKRVPAGVQ